MNDIKDLVAELSTIEADTTLSASLGSTQAAITSQF